MPNSAKLVITTLGLTLLVGCGDKAVEVTDPAAETAIENPAVAVAEEPSAAVDQNRLDTAAEQPEHWITYGGSYDETRQSS